MRTPAEAREALATLRASSGVVPLELVQSLVCNSNGHERPFGINLMIRSSAPAMSRIVTLCGGCGRELA